MRNFIFSKRFAETLAIVIFISGLIAGIVVIAQIFFGLQQNSDFFFRIGMASGSVFMISIGISLGLWLLSKITKESD